ncbi:MAG: YhcH/YjgK/YiaL family protein [Lachnospiraceae bacterium]|nr:YhcH/YjgK/YiaL family protein [Lachnospiraceae bacterium]
MIYNDIEQLRQLNEEAYAILTQFGESNWADGRYNFDSGLYMNVESYSTQLRESRRFESHKKYIDVQYMISGEELITVAHVDSLDIDEDYNSDKDILFYKNCLNGVDYLLNAGSFIVLNPEEAHMPCICVNGSKTVKKAVIKIPVGK